MDGEMKGGAYREYCLFILKKGKLRVALDRRKRHHVDEKKPDSE